MSREDRDSLRSIAKARVIDAVCEGEIEGLVAGLQSLFLDGTPVQNRDGTDNFSGVDVAVRRGLQNQERIDWVAGVEDTSSVGIEVVKDVPIERTLTDPAVDAARVVITVSALLLQQENGDLLGTSVEYKIAVKTAAGSFVDQPLGFDLVSLPGSGEAWTSGTTSTAATRIQGVVRGACQLDYQEGIGWAPKRLVVNVQYRVPAGSWTTIKTFDLMAGLGNADSAEGYYDDGAWQSRVAATGQWKAVLGSFDVEVAEGTAYEVRTLIVSGASGAWFSPLQELRRTKVLRIEGKSSSAYQRGHLVPLPAGGAPWTIRVERITPDATTNRLQNRTVWDSLTAIYEEKLRYPHTALVGLAFDAKQFSSIPERSYHLRLLKIKVPSNYDPIARTYSGTWDGTFQVAWSNNPVWCFYDLATNPRYGTGDYITEAMLDKWSLYAMAVYCDELVSDGRGGQEPRFTCNLYLQTREEAYRVLQNMAAIFRAMTYWGAGTLNLSQDRPSDPVYLFANANVIDGAFEYTGSSQRVRRNAVLVAWNDPAERYKQAVEYVDDPELIVRWGYVSQTEIVAMGCTSRAMAYRVGRWLLYTERYESEMVTFETGLEGNIPRPGDVIQVADQHRAGSRIGGRVVAVPTATTVTLDQAVTLAAGLTYTLAVLNDAGELEERTVTTAAGSTATLTIASAWTGGLSAQSIWVLSSSALEPELYRVVSVAEREGGAKFAVTALLHNPSKFAVVDEGASLTLRTTSVLVDPRLAPPAPSGLAASDTIYVDSAKVVRSKITFSWAPVTTGYVRGYVASFRLANGNWIALPETQTPAAEIIDVIDGAQYQLRVVAVSQLGLTSDTPAAITYTPLGKAAPPATVGALAVTINASAAQAELAWPAIADLDLDLYEVRLGASWAGGTVVFRGKALNATLPIAGLSMTFRVRALDTAGNYSAADSAATITIEPPGQPVIVAEVIDNNVLLRWQDVPGSLAISTYEIRRGAAWASAEVIGTKTGLFTTVFETQAGTFTYWVAGIDRAGNYGTPGQVVVPVSAPPDYVLQIEQAPVWAAFSNAAESDGRLYLPVSASETWETHFTARGWTSPQDQIDAGYPYFIQPGESSGYAEAVVDAGSTLPSSKITITASLAAISGSPSASYTISVSNTSASGPWTDYAGAQAFATAFRWAKVKIAIAGGIAEVFNAIVRMEVKERSDSGEAAVAAADVGGTTIDFTVPFVSVKSITVTPKGTTARFAIYDFAGGANPTSFKALLYDTAGNRVSGTVSWQAAGV
jgi:predicted phage tail protein